MFAANIILAIIWTALTNELSWINLVFGFMLGYLVLYFAALGGITGRPDYIWRVFTRTG